MIERFVIIRKFENVINSYIVLNNTLYKNQNKSNMSADYIVWHLKKYIIQVKSMTGN